MEKTKERTALQTIKRMLILLIIVYVLIFMNSQVLAEDFECNADVETGEVTDDDQIAFTRPYMPYNIEEKDNIIILSKETKMAEFHIPEEKYIFVWFEPVYPIEFNVPTQLMLYKNGVYEDKTPAVWPTITKEFQTAIERYNWYVPGLFSISDTHYNNIYPYRHPGHILWYNDRFDLRALTSDQTQIVYNDTFSGGGIGRMFPHGVFIYDYDSIPHKPSDKWRMKEADIVLRVFEDSRKWTDDIWEAFTYVEKDHPTNPSLPKIRDYKNFYIKSNLLHELGHVIGLGHSFGDTQVPHPPSFAMEYNSVMHYAQDPFRTLRTVSMIDVAALRHAYRRNQRRFTSPYGAVYLHHVDPPPNHTSGQAVDWKWSELESDLGEDTYRPLSGFIIRNLVIENLGTEFLMGNVESSIPWWHGGGMRENKLRVTIELATASGEHRRYFLGEYFLQGLPPNSATFLDLYVPIHHYYRGFSEEDPKHFIESGKYYLMVGITWFHIFPYLHNRHAYWQIPLDSPFPIVPPNIKDGQIELTTNWEHDLAFAKLPFSLSFDEGFLSYFDEPQVRQYGIHIEDIEEEDDINQTITYTVESGQQLEITVKNEDGTDPDPNDPVFEISLDGNNYGMEQTIIATQVGDSGKHEIRGTVWVRFNPKNSSDYRGYLLHKTRGDTENKLHLFAKRTFFTVDKDYIDFGDVTF